MTGTTPPPVLDRRQLERIQSVHRGFLYQHLYAAACLLRAGVAATTTVRVETDEDVEAVGATGCHYIQVKTRSGLLVFSDVGKVGEKIRALGLTDLKHSFGVGVTLRAGNLAYLQLYYAWGGGEGSHTNFSGSSNNLAPDGALRGVF